MLSTTSTKIWSDLSTGEYHEYPKLKWLSTNESHDYQKLKWLSTREYHEYPKLKWLSALESHEYQKLKWLSTREYLKYHKLKCLAVTGTGTLMTTYWRIAPNMLILLGVMVVRTHDVHKNPSIHVFLRTVLGLD